MHNLNMGSIMRDNEEREKKNRMEKYMNGSQRMRGPGGAYYSGAGGTIGPQQWSQYGMGKQSQFKAPDYWNERDERMATHANEILK